MGLTINNANTLSLLNILNRTSTAQSNTLTRLSTGSKINKGADDPAGLIAVQSLTSELTSVDAAISNGQRAKSVLDTADGALTEVSSLISEIQSLAASSTSSGGLSAAEIAANQAQIDNAIDSINRIIQTTTFNGKRLLDGSQSILASASDSDVTDLKIFSRPTSTTSQSLSVDVVSIATHASAVVATSATAPSAAEFTVAGRLGTATITVADTDQLAQVRDKVIAAASQTGVSAYVTSNKLVLLSRGFGENEFVSANRISGDTEVTGASYTAGVDAAVNVNGQAAFVDGLNVSFSSNGTSGQFTLASTGNVVGSQGTLSITSGGATFQLGTTSNTQATLGVAGLFTHQLGNSTVGYLNTLKSGGSNALAVNANSAVSIAQEALNQVATQQGRIGGFQKFQVDTSLNSLNATKEALQAARGVIQDVDFAQETAELSRQNVLLQSAISLLGVASQQSGQILNLLR